LYNGRSHYNEWTFVAQVLTSQMGGGANGTARPGSPTPRGASGQVGPGTSAPTSVPGTMGMPGTLPTPSRP
jgi:hypothetical protein